MARFQRCRLLDISLMAVKNEIKVADDNDMVNVQICSSKRNRMLVSSDMQDESGARQEAELWVAAQPSRQMEIVARLRLVDNCGVDREYLVVDENKNAPPPTTHPLPHHFGVSRGDVLLTSAKAA